MGTAAVPPLRPLTSSFRNQRVVGASPDRRRLLEHDEQRDHGECGDHQELIVVDVGDDLRLRGHDRIKGSPPGGGDRIPELHDGRVLEGAVDCGDVCCDVGVIDLRVADQESIHNGYADARADVAREIVDAGSFRAPVRRCG